MQLNFASVCAWESRNLGRLPPQPIIQMDGQTDRQRERVKGEREREERWSVCRGVDGIIIKTLNRKQKQFATLALDKQFLAVRKSADTDKSIGKRNEQSTLSPFSLSHSAGKDCYLVRSICQLTVK